MPSLFDPQNYVLRLEVRRRLQASPRGFKLFFLFVYVINAEECTGKGGSFAECDKEGFVDLSLRVDEDSAEEENQPTDGEDKRCYELDVGLHKFGVFLKYVV